MIDRVVHCRRQPFDVYIGRPSKWGNPFEIGRDGDRSTVIGKYRQYLTEHPELVAAARRELRGKVLGCWCHPKPCHGDVLVEIANGDSPVISAAEPEIGPQRAAPKSVRAIVAGLRQLDF